MEGMLGRARRSVVVCGEDTRAGRGEAGRGRLAERVRRRGTGEQRRCGAVVLNVTGDVTATAIEPMPRHQTVYARSLRWVVLGMQDAVRCCG
jgi:hypothetical protein